MTQPRVPDIQEPLEWGRCAHCDAPTVKLTDGRRAWVPFEPKHIDAAAANTAHLREHRDDEQILFDGVLTVRSPDSRARYEHYLWIGDYDYLEAAVRAARKRLRP